MSVEKFNEPCEVFQRIEYETPVSPPLVVQGIGVPIGDPDDVVLLLKLIHRVWKSVGSALLITIVVRGGVIQAGGGGTLGPGIGGWNSTPLMETSGLELESCGKIMMRFDRPCSATEYMNPGEL